MRRLLIILVMVGLSWAEVASGPAQAGFISGQELLEMCEGPTADMGWCGGYVVGVADGFTRDDATDGWTWTPPQSGMNVKQAVAVALKFLKDHPEKLHFNASGLVAQALDRAFPCP